MLTASQLASRASWLFSPVSIEFLIRRELLSFIEPPQADVIEAILDGHRRAAMVGGLGQSRSPRAPPEVDELVLELDAGDADNSIHSADEANASQEPSYVDIDTFLENF